MAHNVRVLLKAGYLENVRPATVPDFENQSVRLRNDFFGTIATICCLVKTKCPLFIRQAPLLAIPMLAAALATQAKCGVKSFIICL